jgi:hypothetical protein
MLYARRIHADALRLEGEYLARSEKAKPAGSNQHKDRSQKVTDPLTLKQQGIRPRESRMAQVVAKAPKRGLGRKQGGKGRSLGEGAKTRDDRASR